MKEIDKNTMLKLLEHFDNNVTVFDDDNEMIFIKLGTSFTPTLFAVQFNGKFLKQSKRIETSLKFFNNMLLKYNISTEPLLEEFSLQSN